MASRRKLIGKISNESGFLSDGKGLDAKVRFSINQWQDILDENLPGLKSGDGIIEFENMSQAFSFFNSGERLTLQGGGITASVFMRTTDEFVVTGPITKL